MHKYSKKSSHLDHHFKKSLGQNFILDDGLLEALVDAAEVTAEDGVLEIGPGSGSMTVALARRARKILAVELDQDLLPILDQSLAGFPHARVIHGDALKVDLGALIVELGAPCRLVANLPYYITTPLLLRILTENLPLRGIAVMVQAEVGEKLLACPGQGSYGPLAIWAQILTIPREALHVPAEAFTPKPKVDSSFMVLSPREEPLITSEQRPDLERLIRVAFSMRRKTLRNNLQSGYGLTKEQAGEAIEEAGLLPMVRAEEMGPEALRDLAILLRRKYFSK